MSTQKKFIFGNWKMAQSLSKVEAFVSEWASQVNPSLVSKEKGIEVALFPSYLHLPELLPLKPATFLGAQDCSDENAGAFTGEVSASQLKELGVTYVLVGHSERRIRFRETNDLLTRKLRQVLEAQLVPVFCIGENLMERERNQVESVLTHHLRALEDVSRKRVIVAYEPVWAIGTGKVASVSDIEGAHAFIRKLEPDLKAVLYGGSVKPENAEAILKLPGVDGLLVGGASLNAKDFKLIVESVKDG